MGFFGSSKHSPPSWTPGSFPAGPMQVVGYSPYSSSAVWQPQPVMMAYPPSPMIVQVPVPVQVPVHVPAHTPVAVSPAAFTPGTTFTVVQHTPATNTLHLEMVPSVPSPRITHSIPLAPPPRHRSPRPPAPQLLAQDQWSQLQAQAYSTQQQQQHGSPPIIVNIIQTPQHAQAQLHPGSTPGPVQPPVLPPSETPQAAPPVTNDDGASDGDDSTGSDDPHHDHNHDRDIRQPVPIRSPNIHLSFSFSPHPGLSPLSTSSPLPPTPYRRIA